jgi:galactofuranose transport system permease protein
MRSRYIPLIATIVVFVGLYLIGLQRFPGFGRWPVPLNFLTDKAFLGVAAVGMTFVIISGGIDLSVGSVIAFTGVFCAILIEQSGLHPLIVFALALALGAAFGGAMGAIIHSFKIPPFIVTLAGMFLARGMAFVLTKDSIPITHPFFNEVYAIHVKFPNGGRFTAIGMLFLLVVAVAIFVAHFTRFGRNVYAMGGSPSAALLMGVPIARTTVLVYALSSFLAALAGIIYSLLTDSGYPLAAVGVELDAIAAVVIGGTLLTGGVGFVAGTFLGVLIQGVIQTYINFDGSLNSWWTKIAIGLLLFGFIVMQKLVSARGTLLAGRRMA